MRNKLSFQCTSCENQVKAVVVAKPVEECDLEPQKTCRHVTKLVPYLRAVEECVDVPQEVCGVSRVDPVKKKRPSIQWWCVDEPDEQTPTTSNASTTTSTSQGEVGISKIVKP